jgi:hypothetical protein
MFPLRLGCASLFLTFLAPVLSAQDKKDEISIKPTDDVRDQTLLRRVSERTFVHDATRVAYTVPEGWKEIRPHRLRRDIDPRISTVLRIERPDLDLVASLYWIQMNPGQKLSEWVRDTTVAGEYGEEYETLRAVYGKDRVSIPVKMTSGQFEVFRINITGGPERGEKYDGALFVFAVESGGTTWLMKARISYPKGDRGRNDQYATSVLQGLSRVPPKGDK